MSNRYDVHCRVRRANQVDTFPATLTLREHAAPKVGDVVDVVGQGVFRVDDIKGTLPSTVPWVPKRGFGVVYADSYEVTLPVVLVLVANDLPTITLKF